VVPDAHANIPRTARGSANRSQTNVSWTSSPCRPLRVGHSFFRPVQPNLLRYGTPKSTDTNIAIVWSTRAPLSCHTTGCIFNTTRRVGWAPDTRGRFTWGIAPSGISFVAFYSTPLYSRPVRNPVRTINIIDFRPGDHSEDCCDHWAIRTDPTPRVFSRYVPRHRGTIQASHLNVEVKPIG